MAPAAASPNRHLRDEEHHVGFVETQLDLIGRIGIQSWIQLNSDPAGGHE